MGHYHEEDMFDPFHDGVHPRFFANRFFVDRGKSGGDKTATVVVRHGPNGTNEIVEIEVTPAPEAEKASE